MKNKYFHQREEPTSTPTCFFLVVTVTNSSLLSGDISRNISISFSNRTFPHAIAAVGDVLSEKVLFLPTFQQGVSITTARRPTKGTGQATIQGLTPSSHHPRRHNEMEQGMPPYLYCPTKLINNFIFIFTALLPWDAKGPLLSFISCPLTNTNILPVPIYNSTKSFTLSQYKSLQTIADEISLNSTFITIFTLTTYPYCQLSSALQNEAVNTSLTFNIQSIIWLAYPSKEAKVNPSILPSPPIGVTDDYLVDDTTGATQPEIIVNENEDLI